MTEQTLTAEATNCFPGDMADLLPDPDDRDYKPFWEGTRAHELRVPRCSLCGLHRWPPRPACPGCRSRQHDWVPLTGRGRLFTWTVVWHTSLEQYRAAVPFAVAVIEAEDAPVRFIGHVAGCAPDQLQVGMPLEVQFVPVEADVVLPTWKP